MGRRTGNRGIMPSERKAEIMELLQEKTYCTIEEIANTFEVSKVTVHRIFNELEEENQITKVRGGAKLYEPPKIETRFTARLRIASEYKTEIALKAVELIEEGDSIFLESSTTCFKLAEVIVQSDFQNLTVITNGPAIADELAKAPQIHVIVTGGEYDSSLNTLGGPLALYAIAHLQFKKVFLSALAVSLQGPMTSIALLLDIKKKLMEAEDREFNLLVDSTKFSSIAPHVIYPISRIRRIVTDSRMDPELAEAFQSRGVELLY